MKPTRSSKKSSRLQLKRATVRVLSAREIRQVAGGLRRACCDLGTELLNPFSGGGGGPCCDLTTELLNPFSN